MTTLREQLRSTDRTTRLHAYYTLGQHLYDKPDNQIAEARRKYSPFTVKASQRCYRFFQKCGENRIGCNPIITATLLARCSADTFNNLVVNELLSSVAGAPPEGGNDLLPF